LRSIKHVLFVVVLCVTTDLLADGALDRYDWKILGKKEMLISYNNQNMREYMTKSNIADLLTPHHPNPELTRYERHRVWQIQATLKPKQRHIYKARTFYFDEDSWSMVMADQYNAKGELVRFSFRHSGYERTLPGHLLVMDSFYDVSKKKYFIQGAKKDGVKFSNKALPSSLILPKSLAAFAKRKNGDSVFQ